MAANPFAHVPRENARTAALAGALRAVRLSVGNQ